jgi:hypothetical protein
MNKFKGYKNLKFPETFIDIKIIYKNKQYIGYYEGENCWRLYTSNDGKNDLRVDTLEIDGWEEEYESIRID